MRDAGGLRARFARLVGPGLGPLGLILTFGAVLGLAQLGAEPAQLDPEGHALAVTGRLDINSATLEELDALPRIGPSLAARIVEARPFEAVEDLERVRGIGPATREDLADFVVVAR